MSTPKRSPRAGGPGPSSGLGLAPGPTPIRGSLLAAAMDRRLAAGTLPFRLVGAHDALSARLGEEAGFDGIWAGSLEVSASHAVPDTGSLPIEATAERVAEMARSVSIPVLVDVDAGLDELPGTIALLEAAGAAGVALEDKRHPKANSLTAADHRLDSIAGFCGRLRSAMARRSDPSFAVVARVETLTAGGTVDDAVERCVAYAAEGVDALIVHSRSATGDDALATIARLCVPVPIGVIPTRFPGRSASDLRRAGAGFVIYANHGIRAEIQALRWVFGQIERLGSSAAVEAVIATIDEVFEVQERSPGRADRNGHDTGAGDRSG